MKKPVIIGIIVVVILAVGGFLIFHKSSPDKSTSSTPTTSTNTPAASTPSTSSTVIIQTKTASNVGQYLADGSGRTLYTYDGDNPSVSNCTGSCLSAWPAYTTTSTTASLPTGVAIIKRSDNDANQYTYKTKPLYYFASDGAGQVTGDGVNSFHVAKP